MNLIIVLQKICKWVGIWLQMFQKWYGPPRPINISDTEVDYFDSDSAAYEEEEESEFCYFKILILLVVFA